MKRIINSYNILAVFVLAMLIAYTHYEMLALGFNSEGTPLVAVSILMIELSTIYIFIVYRNKIHSSFSKLWIFWIIWLFLFFYIFGMKGNGIANILHVTFAPMVFLFFFTVSHYSKNISLISIIGFFILFGVAIWHTFLNLTQVQFVNVGEDMAVTNLVFWSLCTLPFLLLVIKSWQKAIVIVLMAIIVLLTGKRSATIAIFLISLVFVYNESRNGNNARNIIGIVVIGSVLYYLVSTNFEGAFMGILNRMESLDEDEGSGRIPIYKDVLNSLDRFTFDDWIIGRGYGSIKETHHTNAHNDPLQMLYEYGIVGMVVYIRLLYLLIIRLIILKRSKSFYYIGYAASIIITLMLGAVSNLFVFNSYFAFLCAFWGMVEAQLIKDRLIKYLYFRIG